MDDVDIDEIAEQAKTGIDKAFGSLQGFNRFLDQMAPPPKAKALAVAPVRARGMKMFEMLARTLRVPKSSLFRIAIFDIMVKNGFDASQILEPHDKEAILRLHRFKTKPTGATFARMRRELNGSHAVFQDPSCPDSP